MRVLLLGETARCHNGGANRVVVESCNWLQRLGHEPALVYEYGDQVEVSCPVFPLRVGAPADQLGSILESFRPDVVQVHHVTDLDRLEFLSQRIPTSVFLHDQSWFCLCGDRVDRNFTACHRPHGLACLYWNYAQGCGAKRPSNNLIRWQRTNQLMRLRGLGTVRIQVASRFMSRGLRENGYDLNRVDVVPLFADPEVPAGVMEPGLILLPSRLVPAKGVQVAIEAVARLADLPWRLVIAGDGWHRPALERLAKRLGISERVEFLGEVTPAHLGQWYQRAQMVLFPVLREEPFGLVGVEALAHGRPIVAFGGGGVEEWLWNGETGLQVDEKTATAFGNAIRELLTDPSRSAAMGAAAAVRAAKFHPAAYIGRLMESLERTRSGTVITTASPSGPPAAH